MNSAINNHGFVEQVGRMCSFLRSPTLFGNYQGTGVRSVGPAIRENGPRGYMKSPKEAVPPAR